MMMIRIARTVALGALVAAVSVGSASAAPITFVAILSGAAETPPNASPGTGFAEVTIDEVAHTLEVSATFAGLLGTTTAAHIHVINGPGDTNTSDTAGPVATMVPTFVGFPLGVSSGTYFHTFDTLMASTFNPSFVTNSGGVAAAEAALFDAIVDGRAYFNIHTTLFGGGEIRGFLAPPPTPVPEPTSLLLVGFGGAFVALVRRRSSRR